MTPATDDEGSGSGRDVVLVTVDCWRTDALQEMPRLRARLDGDGFVRASAVCAAPATRGAFAALFGGRYYPHVYAGFDEVRDDVTTLPAALSAAGYATGGFVGSNPFLNAWKTDFDVFWNDRLDEPAPSTGRERVRQVVTDVRHAANYLRLRGHVPAARVGARASDWYRRASRPRFLWMHLMDAHAPYFPGIRRALGIGPLAVYRSHWQLNRDPYGLSRADRRTLRECYRRSVASLDAQLDRVLGFLDDEAVVVVTGDHGEEFDHGGFGHARLYDEVVRVPLLVRGVPHVADGDVVRQLDLGATALDALSVPVPDGWAGRPHDGEVRDAFMLNHSPRFGTTYAALRTEDAKLIRSTDNDTGEVVNRECFDLVADPAETVDVSPDGDADELADRLDQFLDGDGVLEGIREHERTDTTAAVEDRLKALGYQ